MGGAGSGSIDAQNCRPRLGTAEGYCLTEQRGQGIAGKLLNWIIAFAFGELRKAPNNSPHAMLYEIAPDT